MSIKIVEEQVRSFLASDKSEVIAIKGDWGTGKTYCWNKWLKSSRDDAKVAFGKYSYVSMFGIESLRMLKLSIFQNLVELKHLDDPSFHPFKNLKGLRKTIRNVFSLAEMSGVKNYTGTIIESFAFSSIKDSIICIDDLERCPESLDVKDILSVANFLCETRNCKVILILNKSILKDVESYNIHHEKVIDKELEFSPSPEDCYSVIFDCNQIIHKDKIKEVITLYRINNIRIIKRIDILLAQIQKILSSAEVDLRYLVISYLCLFTGSIFGSNSNKNIPDLDYIKKWSPSFSTNEKDDDIKRIEQKRSWDSLLYKIGYIKFDELCEELVLSINRGYFIEDDIRHVLGERNEYFIQKKKDDKYHESWRKFHYSFQTSKDDVLDDMYASFRDAISNMSMNGLNATYRLFVELNEIDKAKELLEFFIENRKVDVVKYKKDSFWSDDITEKEILKRFDDEIKEYHFEGSIEDILKTIRENRGWSLEHPELLSKASVDDFYSLFMKMHDSSTNNYIKICLEYGERRDANENWKEVRRKSIIALDRIAELSEINKSRVKRKINEVKA